MYTEWHHRVEYKAARRRTCTVAASAAMRAASVSGSGGGFEGGYNDDFGGGKIGWGARGRLYDHTVIAVSLAM